MPATEPDASRDRTYRGMQFAAADVNRLFGLNRDRRQSVVRVGVNDLRRKRISLALHHGSRVSAVVATDDGDQQH